MNKVTSYKQCENCMISFDVYDIDSVPDWCELNKIDILDFESVLNQYCGDNCYKWQYKHTTYISFNLHYDSDMNYIRCDMVLTDENIEYWFNDFHSVNQLISFFESLKLQNT